MNSRVIKVHPASPARRVAVLFGGMSGLARAISKPVSTVQRWLESGFIHPRYQTLILGAATVQGIVVDATVFLPQVGDGLAPVVAVPTVISAAHDLPPALSPDKVITQNALARRPETVQSQRIKNADRV